MSVRGPGSTSRRALVSRRRLGLAAASAAAVLVVGCSRAETSGDRADAAPSTTGPSPSATATGTARPSAAATADGPALRIVYNADEPNMGWVQAVCVSLSRTLGVVVEPEAVADLAALDERLAAAGDERASITSSDHRPERPAALALLKPFYGTGGAQNTTGYSAPEVDSLLEAAASATDDDARRRSIGQAQELILRDLPQVPLWYCNGTGGRSTLVDAVALGWNGLPALHSVTTTRSDGVVRAHVLNPVGPLLPAAAVDAGGARVVDLLFSGLVSYASDGSTVNEVASSIETADQQTFTIRLVEGWTFSDGSPVTSDSFIKAWDYTAQRSHGMAQRSLLAPVEGYAEEGDSPLTGLERIDDHSFTVRLSTPVPDFPSRLGCAAFHPLPDSAYEDMEAFGERPVGNGPYRLTEWIEGARLTLEAADSYPGPRTPENRGLTLVVTDDYDAAYNELLADRLDVLDRLPDSALPTVDDDLGDRVLTGPAATLQCLAITGSTAHLGQDEEGRARRAAISRAIDRAQVCETLYYGTRTPATDLTSPAVPGWTGDVAGNEVLEHDAEEARRLWAAAEAISPL